MLLVPVPAAARYSMVIWRVIIDSPEQTVGIKSLRWWLQVMTAWGGNFSTLKVKGSMHPNYKKQLRVSSHADIFEMSILEVYLYNVYDMI